MHQIHIPATEIEIQYSRSSGAGGQNVNKVNTKATLRWHLWNSSVLSAEAKQRFATLWQSRITKDGEVVLDSEKFRTQNRNRDDVIMKLKDMIAKALAKPKKRHATKPTKASKQRRLDTKKQRSKTKNNRKSVAWD